ncbi:ammonium transporter Rh type A isoform X2 [Tribolium castaneum]|uniref:ammonium transporter Rh type A isoform X2 n=1 Tax=Tribolium castaneum TaxID=7070 RepID=UPI00077DB4E6|nr:PREDICTED: ammonium transporter Rh type A isoform X2 [Tribolium castaneum]|eukprot:XP_015835084.1 PREDICTED: ammonium transporter Rh type A isoform X2 [Tribolium castaneum]
MRRFCDYHICNRSSTNSNNPTIEKIQRFKLALITFFFQLTIAVIFLNFAEYSDEADASDPRNSFGPVFGGFKKRKLFGDYKLFQDIHVMIFIGFGFLMTFLRRYGYSAVGFNFLLGALIIQWALLCQGFYQLNENNKMKLGIGSLYKADIAAATVLISMGAVLGRTSYMQLLIMGIVEIAVFSANSFLGSNIFQVADAGGSMFVHAFGAYFGLAVSYVIELKKAKTITDNGLEESRYTSDLFAMIGTIFLWLYWPSFNAVELTGDGQQRAVMNTYLSLASCCVTTFAVSLIFSKNHKFDMVHVQNSTLAGGVAVGTTANLMLQPFGAVLIGAVAGVVSVAGYAKLTPWLSSNFGIRDTCGVHNLHGIPGVLAGLIGAFMAGIASEATYCKTLYEIYPARASPNMTATAEYTFLKPGLGRDEAQQAGYQTLALVVTVTLAVASGLLTGMLVMWENFLPLKEECFDDRHAWHLPRKKAEIGSMVTFKPMIKNNYYSVFERDLF